MLRRAYKHITYDYIDGKRFIFQILFVGTPLFSYIEFYIYIYIYLNYSVP